MVSKELSLNPHQSTAYTEREHGIRAGQCVRGPFPPRGQAGLGTLHSELLDKSVPSPRLGFFNTIHLDFSWQTVVAGGCRGQGGSGEGALPEPPAWEVPPKALCSCKADCNSLESFFYPLLNSLSLSDNLF